jgi:hypothetical protein
MWLMSRRLSRRAAHVALALSLTSVLVVGVVRTSTWWCNRQLDQMAAVGSHVLKGAETVHKRTYSCSGQAGRSVTFQIESMNRRQVGDLFKRDGWTDQGSTSPDGRYQIEDGTLRDAHYAHPYVLVTIFSAQTQGAGD